MFKALIKAIKNTSYTFSLNQRLYKCNSLQNQHLEHRPSVIILVFFFYSSVCHRKLNGLRLPIQRQKIKCTKKTIIKELCHSYIMLIILTVILLLNKVNCVYETINVFSQCHVTQHFGNQKGSVTLRSVCIHAEQGSLSIT